MLDPRNNLWKREAASLFDADDDRQRPNVEPRKASSSFDAADDQRRPDAPPVWRYSISASSLSQDTLASKVRRLKDNVQVLSLTEARVFLPSLECRHLTFHVAEDHEGVPSIVKILESSPSLEKLLKQMTCTRSSAQLLFYPIKPGYLSIPILSLIVCHDVLYLRTKFIAENVELHNLDAKEFWISANRMIYRCLMHLKNVEIIDPGADWLAWGPVLSLLEFLLQNVPWLDKIEINSNNSKLSKADDMAQIILSRPNRSPSFKVIHSYPSQGCSSKSVHNA